MWTVWLKQSKLGVEKQVMCYKKLKWGRNELFSLVQGNRDRYKIQKRKFSQSGEISQREKK